MIPHKLKLSNFTSYGENPPELDFSKFQMAAITGLNGVGKSSLLDAITWAVWGTSRAGDSSDSLIRLGQNLMLVEFDFQLDSHIYKVKRVRKLNSTTQLEFWSSSHNLTEGTIKATQQKIIDTLHLTYDTFINSCYIRQGRADEFTTKGPSERKKILADILGLSAYDSLEEKAKEKTKDAAIKLQLLDYQLLEIEAELSMKDTRQLEVSTAKAEAEAAEKELIELEKEIRLIDSEAEVIKAKFESLKEKATRVQTAKTELQNIKIQIEIKEKAKDEYANILAQKEEIEKNCFILSQLNDQKKSLDLKRSELIHVKDQLAEIQKTLQTREDKRKSAIASLQVDSKELETKSKSIEDEINHLKSHKDICSTCGQPINQEKNQQMLDENQKKLTEINSQLDDLQEKLKKYQQAILPETKLVEEKGLEVKKLEDETKNWNEINQQILSLQKYENLNLRLKEASSSLKAHSDAIVDLQKIYQSQLQLITKEESELEGLGVYEIQLKEVGEKLNAKLLLKQEQSSIAQSARSKLGAAEQLMSRTTQLEKVLNEKKTEQSKLKKDKEIYEELSLAFGKKGIQAMIIETAIPEIEEETNKLLDKLTDGRMKVRLDTQRETKTKVSGGERGLVETLDIIISDEMGERSYEMYSGGEAFRVNLALRLALSKLLTHRAGAKLQFLIIDEGFGTQDNNGISRIVEALATIKDDFAKILIITHLDELKEEFETRIEVSKGATGSTFQLVGA